MYRFRSVSVVLVLSIVAVGPGCDGELITSPPYEPELPTEWAPEVTNPYFPLVPTTVLQYEGETEDGLESIVVQVLVEAREIMGVSATVVRDRVYLEGELVEDTYDWFAQDVDGNVWYLGEDSREIEDGEVVGSEGSWEWGVDGALPGIIMWASPEDHIGEAYRQEYYEGEAEDWGKVRSVDEEVSIAFGNFTDCVRIEEWNGLKSSEREYKYYCSGTGLVLEEEEGLNGERVELVGRIEP
jgi:hypothetical protein